ncbi:MAG: hypothetical protein AAGC55_26275, partial [Myxococcota bacterium]
LRGQALFELGRTGAARAALDDALVRFDRLPDSVLERERARARWALARVLSTGQRRPGPRARTLAGQALRVFAAEPAEHAGDRAAIAAIRRWLAGDRAR